MKIQHYQSVKEYVEHLICEILLQEHRPLDDDEKLKELGLDSIDMLELALIIELDISDIVNMRITIEDEDFFVCSTVGDVVSLIRKRISSRSRS